MNVIHANASKVGDQGILPNRHASYYCEVNCCRSSCIVETPPILVGMEGFDVFVFQHRWEAIDKTSIIVFQFLHQLK